MEDTDCSDGESLQRLFIQQVNCVLSKLSDLSNRRPVLVAAFLQTQQAYIKRESMLFVILCLDLQNATLITLSLT